MPLVGRKLAASRRRWPRARYEWTPREIERLKFYWADVRLTEIARRLRRSPQSCWEKAHKLGLGLGCPVGYEYLSAAARRTGYVLEQLHEILAWANVKTHLRLSYRQDRLQRRLVNGELRLTGARHRYVDPLEVDEAIRRWTRKGRPLHARQRGGATW